jgi:hypothetical protein
MFASASASRRTGLLAIFGAVSLISVARADEPIRIERHTTVGQEVMLRTHQQFTSNCQSQLPPRVEVIHAPEHGRIDIREADFVNNGTVVGSAHCAGMKLHGIQIYYIPEPGFQGSDSVVWDRRASGVASVRFNAQITVQPVAGDPPAEPLK